MNFGKARFYSENSWYFVHSFLSDVRSDRQSWNMSEDNKLTKTENDSRYYLIEIAQIRLNI